jgi:hypothetical protein
MTSLAPGATDSAERTSCSRLLRALDAVTAAAPGTRKRLVGPDLNFGRELLVALARLRGGWIGWEATNLRGIAEELAFVPLAEQDDAEWAKRRSQYERQVGEYASMLQELSGSHAAATIARVRLADGG